MWTHLRPHRSPRAAAAPWGPWPPGLPGFSVTTGLEGLAMLRLRPGAGSLSLVNAPHQDRKKCMPSEVLGKAH